MNTESAQRAFELYVEELSQWGKRAHKHNFFEIVYVERGSGFQCINEHEFAYSAGNIFLLPPLDCHSFRVKEPSKFYYIRFTDYFFTGADNMAQYGDWFERISYVLANYNRIPGDIISTERERNFIIENIKTVHHEYTVSDGYSHAIIMGIVASILNVLARSIETRYVDDANDTESRFGEILR
ncbi:MAG: AraC family ligand binding domain-containing protein, partial [Verrucomicrobiota bacterium]